MKKLMMAAAIAAVGSIFAEDPADCKSCGNNPDATSCQAAFANVTFKLQTLAPKKVTCGGCEGWCMEQGNRTVEGILWTCCTCNDEYPWQISLWEKKGSIEYTDSLVYGPRTAGSTTCDTQYRAVQEYYVTGSTVVSTSAYEYASETVAMQEGVVANGGFGGVNTIQDNKWTCDYKFNVYTNGALKTQIVLTTPVCASAAEAGTDDTWSIYLKPDDKTAVEGGVLVNYHYTYDSASIPQNSGKWAYVLGGIEYRYSKQVLTFTAKTEALAKAGVTLDKIAALYQADAVITLDGDVEVTDVTDDATCVTTADTKCSWWATDWADMGEWFRYSKKADKVEAFMAYANNGLEVYAAGFGSWDANKEAPKTISGYAVGKIDPTAVCGDMGMLLEVCGEFNCSDNCWADESLQAEEANTFFKGTWNVKYNSSLLKKDMKDMVPSFVYSKRTVTCAE